MIFNVSVTVFSGNQCFLVNFYFNGHDIVMCLFLCMQADKIVNVVDVDSSSVILSHRLSPLNAPPLEKGTPAYLSLQEILIIGNCHEQVGECCIVILSVVA